MATYASAASWWEASTVAMRARLGSGRAGTVTSSQVLPSSRVSLIKPLLVPTQIRPRVMVEGENDSMLPGGGAPGARAAASGGGVWPFGQVRAGLSLLQCAPPSSVAMRYWKPARSSFGFHGANMIGLDDVARSRRSGSTPGLTFTICSLG